MACKMTRKECSKNHNENCVVEGCSVQIPAMMFIVRMYGPGFFYYTSARLKIYELNQIFCIRGIFSFSANDDKDDS